jgi:hypothetical protein
MKHLAFLTVVACLASAGPAAAGFVQITDPSGLSAGDTTAIYTGVDGDQVTSPYSLSAGGTLLTFSNAAGSDFTRVDQGNSWIGAFPNGTKLLWNMDSNSNIGGDTTIAFAPAVTEMGLSVQQDHAVDTTFTATVFEGTTPELTIMVTVPDNGTGTGNLGFIGFRATGSDFISSVVISSTDSSDSSFNDDFAMGPVTFGSAAVTAVPDPASLTLLGLGAAGLVGYGWRPEKKASAQARPNTRSRRSPRSRAGGFLLRLSSAPEG